MDAVCVRVAVITTLYNHFFIRTQDHGSGRVEYIVTMNYQTVVHRIICELRWADKNLYRPNRRREPALGRPYPVSQQSLAHTVQLHPDELEQLPSRGHS